MTGDRARFLLEDHLGGLYRKHVLEKQNTADSLERFKRHLAIDDELRAAAKERHDQIVALINTGMDESTLAQRCFISALHLKFLRQVLAA